MKKTFNADYCGIENPVLKEGKRYLWSGLSENLYSTFEWKNNPCKVVGIENDYATIYDYYDKKDYKCNIKYFQDNGIRFIKLWI